MSNSIAACAQHSLPSRPDPRKVRLTGWRRLRSQAFRSRAPRAFHGGSSHAAGGSAPLVVRTLWSGTASLSRPHGKCATNRQSRSFPFLHFVACWARRAATWARAIRLKACCDCTVRASLACRRKSRCWSQAPTLMCLSLSLVALLPWIGLPWFQLVAWLPHLPVQPHNFDLSDLNCALLLSSCAARTASTRHTAALQ